MSRITREKENSLFLFLAPRKERILPRIWNSECTYGKGGRGARALFKLICLIKFVSIPFLLPREETRLFRNPIDPRPKLIRALPSARPLEEGREKGGEWGIRAAGALIFSLFLPFRFFCPRWTLRERYPHHFLDQGVPFRKQSLRGLAEGAKDTCSTVEIHPEKNGKLEKLELGEKPRFQGGKKNIISEMHEKEKVRRKLETKRLKAVVIRELFEKEGGGEINNVSLLNVFPSYKRAKGGVFSSGPLSRKIKLAFEAIAYQKFVPLPNNFTVDLSGRRAGCDRSFERKLSRALKYESPRNLCSPLIYIKK